ncbi:MAG: helix-turn-helix domain-containing protein [Candidatus Sulfotelmatobacter sp.]
MSKKPRGNKTSKAERAERQARALQLMKEGGTQEAIAELLGISRTTFWRDLQAIEARYVEGSKDDVAAFKKNQYDALIRIESATAEGSIPPDVANALTRIRDSVARLLGLNAPERSLHANVNIEQQVIPIEQQLEYLQAFAGLYEDERLEELDRVKARKRTCRVVMDASWNQKQLPESGS